MPPMIDGVTSEPPKRIAEQMERAVRVEYRARKAVLLPAYATPPHDSVSTLTSEVVDTVPRLACGTLVSDF